VSEDNPPNEEDGLDSSLGGNCNLDEEPPVMVTAGKKESNNQ
jgi:hypothetical protein